METETEDDNRQRASGRAAFKNSVWFTRAWTLQELLAPKTVLFFSKTYTLLGTRENFDNLVHEATSIPVYFLGMNLEGVFDASVAERMRWASRREASREEDLSYSILGLFGVNIPLLYGEGGKAFLRLQEEIVKTSWDETLFAWNGRSDDCMQHMLAGGLIASHPRHFEGATILGLKFPIPRQHYEITNRGVRMSIPLSRGQFDRVLAEGMPRRRGLTFSRHRGRGIPQGVLYAS
ncbi:uncharacterized protein LTR77_002050 [Saxophila tyrrhenica]|uniref:DUF8212 domain-containing protein n=1 Tax=Saxophila tyrrhenica TaxID=1690608 RepID=A0AAV9PHF7_9PEZI|nr:hypothetical protein LTR77_002050 [Saxophila tyrrhenica]